MTEPAPARSESAARQERIARAVEPFYQWYESLPRWLRFVYWITRTPSPRRP